MACQMKAKAKILNTFKGDKNFDANFNKISKHIDDNLTTAVNNLRFTINMQDINTDMDIKLIPTLFQKVKINMHICLYQKAQPSVLWYKNDSTSTRSMVR